MYNINLTPYYKIFDDAPISAAILHAETFKLEMANQQMLALWGRSSGIIGVPLLDFLPELVGQRYPEYLKKVCHTGQPIQENGAQVLLNRSGKQESVFLDYSYTPIFGEQGKTTGILVMATDVCERELNKLIAQQSIRDVRAMVMSAPVPMCIYRGREFVIEAVNDRMLDLWQGTQNVNLSALKHVFFNGVGYTEQDAGITFTYTPLGSGLKGVAGVCVMATRI